jgi:hypothetical protein
MEDKKATFLPFHAINEFMTDEYRLEVLRAVLSAQPDLPGSYSAAIDRQVKKHVSVPGFRNSVKAPSALKARPLVDAFKKYPDLVAVVLAGWAELNPVLRQQVYDLLISLEWDILPVDADRTKLPGFLPSWLAGQDFDFINNKFQEKYPDEHASNNDISLMTVWLSGRLPYQVPE